MKKKLFIIIIILAFSSYRAQAQMQFESENFSEVLKKAKIQNKKIFIDCYTSWCGPCKMLSAKIFPDIKVGEYMNNEFINFKIDMEKGEGIELRSQFKVNAFPTLLILDCNGEEINRIVGAPETPELFIAEVIKASQVDNSLAHLKKRSDNNIDVADNYLIAVTSRGIPEETEQALTDIFKRRDPLQRYNKSSFKIYRSAIKTIDQNVAVLILKDKENAIKYLGQESYKDFINQKVNDKITSLYMGDIKAGVNLQECANFEEFAKPYQEIQDAFLFKYFTQTYKLICSSQIDEFLKKSFEFLLQANANEVSSISKYIYRIAITSTKKENLITQYEIYKTKLTDSAKIDEVTETIKRLKGEATQNRPKRK